MARELIDFESDTSTSVKAIAMRVDVLKLQVHYSESFHEDEAELYYLG